MHNRVKGLYQKIRNLIRSRGKEVIVEDICHHFKKIGINVKPIQGNSIVVRKSRFSFRLRCIGSLLCEERDIDLIQICSFGYGLQQSYSLHYVIQSKVNGLQEYLKARTEEVDVSYRKAFESITGIGFKKIKNIKWIGGHLAFELNNDSTLNDNIKIRGLKIEPGRKGDNVMIITPKKQDVISLFPTAEEFNTYEKIGIHIQNLIKYFSQARF